LTLENENRIALIQIHLEKAEEAYDDAVYLFETRRSYNGAANRAYYAMFHAEKALLLTCGILGDSHKHVHTQLSKEFVKEGKLSNDTGRKIDYVQKIRNIADYSGQKSATKDDVEMALAEVKSFMEQTRELLSESYEWPDPIETGTWNAETLEAIRDVEEGRAERFESKEALFKNLYRTGSHADILE